MKHSLFRSIRHKLLHEGKLLRYLSYAVGEVVLIIVGILIALKINDWNEDRKAQVEFDEYIVQLKSDVRQAIEDVDDVVAYNDSRVTRGMKAIQVLTDSEFESEDIAAFEAGIQAMGMYHEPLIEIGFLGQLMKGEMGIINRDRDLALRAMQMQSEVHKSLGPMIHLTDQIDINAGHIAKYRGRRYSDWELPVRYDLQEMRASNEFLNRAQTIAQQTAVLRDYTESISASLESFLTVLEQYD